VDNSKHLNVISAKMNEQNEVIGGGMAPCGAHVVAHIVWRISGESSPAAAPLAPTAARILLAIISASRAQTLPAQSAYVSGAGATS
jgi:hypothetical protein